MRNMQFAAVVAGIFLSVVRGNVIPCTEQGNTTVAPLRKVEKYQNDWIGNKSPLEICPAVQASLAPTIKSRICEVDADKEDIDFEKYYVTVGDIKGRSSWLKERAKGNKDIRSQNFCDIKGGKDGLSSIDKDCMWISGKDMSKEHGEKYVMGYLNTKNIVDAIQGPSKDDLRIYLSIDDLANIKLPTVENPQQEAPATTKKTSKDVTVPKKWNHPEENKIVKEFESELSSINDKIPTTETIDVNIGATTTESPNIEDILKEIEAIAGDLGVSGTTTVAPEASDEDKATIGDLKRTGELMNEILEKLKQVEDFEEVEKSVKKFVDNIKTDSTPKITQ